MEIFNKLGKKASEAYKVTANKTAIAENKGAIATNASAIAKAKEDITSITGVLNGCIYYTVIA